MIYTEQQLYDFMDAERPVTVTTVDGGKYTGMCWAYSSVTNEADFGIAEASLEVQDTILYLHEIEKIEYADTP